MKFNCILNFYKIISINLKLNTAQNISSQNQVLPLLKIRPLNITLLWKTKNVWNSKNYNLLIVSNYFNLTINYKILFRKRNMCALHVNLLQNLSLRIFPKHIKGLFFEKRNNNFTSRKCHNPKVMEMTP